MRFVFLAICLVLMTLVDAGRRKERPDDFSWEEERRRDNYHIPGYPHHKFGNPSDYNDYEDGYIPIFEYNNRMIGYPIPGLKVPQAPRYQKFAQTAQPVYGNQQYNSEHHKYDENGNHDADEPTYDYFG